MKIVVQTYEECSHISFIPLTSVLLNISQVDESVFETLIRYVLDLVQKGRHPLKDVISQCCKAVVISILIRFSKDLSNPSYCQARIIGIVLNEFVSSQEDMNVIVSAFITALRKPKSEHPYPGPSDFIISSTNKQLLSIVPATPQSIERPTMQDLRRTIAEQNIFHPSKTQSRSPKLDDTIQSQHSSVSQNSEISGDESHAFSIIFLRDKILARLSIIDAFFCESLKKRNIIETYLPDVFSLPGELPLSTQNPQSIATLDIISHLKQILYYFATESGSVSVRKAASSTFSHLSFVMKTSFDEIDDIFKRDASISHLLETMTMIEFSGNLEILIESYKTARRMKKKSNAFFQPIAISYSLFLVENFVKELAHSQNLGVIEILIRSILNAKLTKLLRFVRNILISKRIIVEAEIEEALEKEKGIQSELLSIFAINGDLCPYHFSSISSSGTIKSFATTIRKIKGSYSFDESFAPISSTTKKLSVIPQIGAGILSSTASLSISSILLDLSPQSTETKSSNDHK
ncbi:hypothetical protein ADUPG1_009807 [Aduncisulcus paluster]|uniref:Uncharacterized protein n=1 Tax=Aduncisulcus paluster TaxID=2918883 RepID=A0ABQ5KWV6_9EUKA|nr:hypothetical protein ADUPG1_009807 [Aduncisulcus paluster]